MLFTQGLPSVELRKASSSSSTLVPYAFLAVVFWILQEFLQALEIIILKVCLICFLVPGEPCTCTWGGDT